MIHGAREMQLRNMNLFVDDGGKSVLEIFLDVRVLIFVQQDAVDARLDRDGTAARRETGSEKSFLSFLRPFTKRRRA